MQQDMALLRQALKEDIRSQVHLEWALLRQVLREEAGYQEQKSKADGETVDEDTPAWEAVQTAVLPHVDRVDNDYRLLSLADLRKMKEPEAIFERFRRGVEAMMAYNSRVNLAQRWYINGIAIRRLVGGQPLIVQAYLDAHRTEIEAHHRTYRLLPDHNQGRKVSIKDCITIPDPEGASHGFMVWQRSGHPALSELVNACWEEKDTEIGDESADPSINREDGVSS